MASRWTLPFSTHLLQHALRSVCTDSQWVYAVFWRILPRNFPPPNWEMDEELLGRSKTNKRNWIMVWEDGYCDFATCARNASKSTPRATTDLTCIEDDEKPYLQPELFFKMSYEIYNYGDGFMGKVAADNTQKWVYSDPSEHDARLVHWNSSIDPQPRTWEAQFRSGIQTIAILAVRDGLVQLGSLERVMQDTSFVTLLRRQFNYLQTIPGVILPHPSCPVGKNLAFQTLSTRPGLSTDHNTHNNRKHPGSSNSYLERTLDKCWFWNGAAGPLQHEQQQQQIQCRNSFFPLSTSASDAIPVSAPAACTSASVMLAVPSMSSLDTLSSRLPAATNLPSQAVLLPQSSVSSDSPVAASLSTAQQEIYSNAPITIVFRNMLQAQPTSLVGAYHHDTQASVCNEAEVSATIKDEAAQTRITKVDALEQRHFKRTYLQSGLEVVDDDIKFNSAFSTFVNIPDLGMQEVSLGDNASRYLQDIVDDKMTRSNPRSY